MSSLLQPFLGLPLLPFFLLLMVLGGWYAYAMLRKSTTTATAATLVAVIVALSLLQIIGVVVQLPVPLRHLRELLVIGAMGSALAIAPLLRMLPRRAAVAAIILLLAGGTLLEFRAIATYERLITVDWGYLEFQRWLREHLSPRAIILTDPFTHHMISSDVPYAQLSIAFRPPPVEPAQDPTTAILGVDWQRFRAALDLLCPEYIIVDRAMTQQFYPIRIQEYPEEVSRFAEVLYNVRTARSHQTVLAVRADACDHGAERRRHRYGPEDAIPQRPSAS